MLPCSELQQSECQLRRLSVAVESPGRRRQLTPRRTNTTRGRRRARRSLRPCDVLRRDRLYIERSRIHQRRQAKGGSVPRNKARNTTQLKGPLAAVGTWALTPRIKNPPTTAAKQSESGAAPGSTATVSWSHTRGDTSFERSTGRSIFPRKVPPDRRRVRRRRRRPAAPTESRFPTRMCLSSSCTLALMNRGP